jgi:hypothetical protein
MHYTRFIKKENRIQHKIEQWIYAPSIKNSYRMLITPENCVIHAFILSSCGCGEDGRDDGGGGGGGRNVS